MRDRPFIAANEPPRPYGDVLAERRALDPVERARDRIVGDIATLEAQAAEAVDVGERKRVQCEAEALRCALVHGRVP